MQPTPFVDHDSYQQWRNDKLAAYPEDISSLWVTLNTGISDQQVSMLKRLCSKTNMAFYRVEDASQADKTFIRALGKKLGLERLDSNLCADNDSITSLQVSDQGRKTGYIPYSNKPLSWHTDGYYNAEDSRIRAIIMHCVRDASEGGENSYLDPEVAYIQVRDKDPRYIDALMDESAMTIPPNIENGVMLRDAQGGPVFSFDPQGHLHMRYSARQRNIEWKNDTLTQEAAALLRELMTPQNPYFFRYKLKPGEGIVCNNVLHSRSGFNDEATAGGRLLYRARYFDRIAED